MKKAGLFLLGLVATVIMTVAGLVVSAIVDWYLEH